MSSRKDTKLQTSGIILWQPVFSIRGTPDRRTIVVILDPLLQIWKHGWH